MDSRSRIEREAAAWLARRDAGDWSTAEQVRFEAWLNAAVAHRVAFIRIESAWRQTDRLRALGAGVPAGRIPDKGEWMLSPFFDGGVESSDSPGAIPIPTGSGRRARDSRRPVWMKFAAFAACLLLIASAGFGWHRHFAPQVAIYATPIGTTRIVALDDGSKAILGSDSRVTAAMSPHDRRIDVQQGEAYFDVAKDAARPFVVEAGGYRVIAVGTRFSVRRDDAVLRVVVVEGVVSLGSGVPGRADLRLPAGSVVLAGKEGMSVRALPVDEAEERLSWRDGFVRFRDTPLAEAVAEFNRYNTRKLVIADTRTAAVLVGGQFRYSNVDAFVRLLQQGFSIRAQERGNEIVLRSE